MLLNKKISLPVLGLLTGTLLLSSAYADENLEEEQQTEQQTVVYYKNRFIIGARANFISTLTEYDDNENTNLNNNVDLTASGTTFGAKIGYRAYFNKNEINSGFIEFEAFEDFGSTKSNDKKSYGDYELEIEPTYGGKISVGCEIARKHAFSVNFGLQNFDYKYRYKYTDSRGTIFAKKDDSELGYLFGVAYEYNITQYVGLNFILDYSSFSFDTPNRNIVITNGYSSKTITNMENSTIAFKVGLNFKF